LSFSLTILGATSAIPAYGRHHSAQVLKVYNKFFLIDCGEGTQLQLSKYRVNINKIHSIFISHLHGDHFLGLFGLLSSMSLVGRTKELHIYGPAGLDEIITIQLKYSQSGFNFPVNFQTVPNTPGLIMELGNMTVESFPLDHSISCNGFLFKEKPKPRRILKTREEMNISLSGFAELKKGSDIRDKDGNLVKNEEVTGPPKRSRSYAYCSDTAYNEDILPFITGVDLLYHESTFLTDMASRAASTKHSTAKQAATIAQKANADTLILGHFSSRYKDIEPIQEEARTVFQNSHLAIEGDTHTVEDQ
jgi:ribonuclease Z